MYNSKEYVLFCVISFTCLLAHGSKTYYINSGEHIYFNPKTLKESQRGGIQIYCHEGCPKHIFGLFRTVTLQLNHASDNYVQYDGQTEEEVRKDYLVRRSSWSPNLFTWKQKNIKLNPFNQTCVGIESRETYSVFLHVLRVDYWKILVLALGLILFLSASKLSTNSLFYYICGVSLGICASFLFLIYFISKLIPKKPMMYGFVVGGWAVGIYVLQMLWENMRTLFTNYHDFIMWYIVLTGLLSFIFCYRMGPPSNQRSKNLIKWTIQLVGLITMFNSSHFQEAAMGIIVISLIFYNFPRRWILRYKSYWKRKFPPKVLPISNDEYYDQGVKETNKALTKLREYCSSPDCNQWETVLKLQNAKRLYNSNGYRSNNRFASFVEGNSHLSDDEVLDYENDSIHPQDLTDDDEITEDSSDSLDL